MTERNRPVDIERRIAAAQAARPPVDHNGSTIGARTVYVYDLDGKLIEAKPGHLSCIDGGEAGQQ